MIAARAAAVALVLVGAPLARADEPRVPGEPDVMREPGEVFVVADAADERDPFDIAVSLAFEVEIERARIARERSAGDETVGSYARLMSRLHPRLEIGLYRDFAATFRFPVILSETREITPRSGSTGSIVAGDEVLVRLPMESVERSGLEHLAAGLVAAVMNQTRDRRFPTWVLGAEARFGLGPTKRACVEDPPEGQIDCADPADVDRDGVRDDGEPALGDTGAGMARSSVTFVLETVIGRRHRYVEPYGLLRGLFELPLPGSLFEQAVGPSGDATPPIRGELGAGLGIFPWENRERFSRVFFDVRASATLHGRGLDYAQMFDAIGSSDAPSLRAPREAGGAAAYTTGLTVVQDYLSVGGAGSFVWQASEFIKLAASVGARYDLPHVITDAKADEPTYRPIVGGEGLRLSVHDSFQVDVGAGGALMF